MKKFFDPEPLIITIGGGGPGLFHITLANMKNAISLGSDVIQANVDVTKDNKIVLFSNTAFTNKDVSAKGIGRYTHNDLKTMFSASSGDKQDDDMDGLFPELDETLKKIKTHRFNLHLSGKNPGLFRQFCDIISANNAEERVLVSSLSGGTIRNIRGVFPDIATCFPFTGAVGFYALHRSGLLYFKRNFIHDALVLPERIGASYLANPGLIKEARARDIRVYVLDVMTEEQVARLYSNGVYGFVTNYAAMVKRVMKRYEGKNDR